MDNGSIYFWSLMGYIGAAVSGLGGIAVAVYAINGYNSDEFGMTTAMMIGGSGLSLVFVTAPIVGCLARIADRVIVSRG